MQEQPDMMPTLIVNTLKGVELNGGYEEDPVQAHEGTPGTYYVISVKVEEDVGFQLAFRTRDEAMQFCAALVQVIAGDTSSL